MSITKDSKNITIDYSQKVLDVKKLKKYFFVGVGKNKLVVPAVDDVSFHIYKREVFGLVGESGCGKTTTGRTIMKLYTPTEGEVDLNGITISGGYYGNLNNIKSLKKELNNKLASFNPVKKEIITIKKELETKIDPLKYDINKLKLELENSLKVIEKEKEEYNSIVYKLKNDYIVDVRSIQYQASLENSNLYSQTFNDSERNYRNELRILKNTYLRKVQGLKDSAALQKETIQQKIQQLKLQYNKDLGILTNRFLPLIEKDKLNILPKNIYKTKKENIEIKKKDDIKARKAKYEEDKQNIIVPNFDDIKKKKEETKLEFKSRIGQINEAINKFKLESKEKIDSFKKTTTIKFSEEEKNQIELIKKEYKDLIEEEKQRIKEIKIINTSSDTLNISRRMQMIFQDPISSLNPRMTVREIIGEGLIIQNQLSKDEIHQRVDEVLEIVGLSREYATRYPHEFSGGQRQRIGIARALIMNPDVIIADEPISALDVSIRAQIINLLQNLKEKLGLTILFIAHDLSVVRFFCDRIAVMYAGKIVELGTSKDIFSNPLHPYTKSLLSAIPQPDPDYEKNRVRVSYKPNQHDYREDKPSLQEISPGHFIYVNQKEFKAIQETLDFDRKV
jgi:oligopeptide transport system ATP-binding protein